jgi:hypothetical protein
MSKKAELTDRPAKVDHCCYSGQKERELEDVYGKDLGPVNQSAPNR